MADGPWLTIVGLGEDGPDGLPPASRAALGAAEVVMGPPRHLALVPDAEGERIAWPVPFAEGLPVLDGLRGRRTVVLTSGDPFWFGAGRAIAARYGSGEWRALPGPSVFSLACARLGWAVEDTLCLGLHAAPLEGLARHLAPDLRAVVTLRDGAAVPDLARWLTDRGFGATRLTVLQALGGPRERVTGMRADAPPDMAFAHPVAAALEVAGDGPVLPRASGLPDDAFAHDGQITKRPMRALALSALAPRPGETLWDIGGGSGSVAVEWCLSAPGTTAWSVEPRADRIATIRENARRYGLTGLTAVEGRAPDALDGLQSPDAVFVGGGLSAALLDALDVRLAPGTRVVAHAVTLESEALLTRASAGRGGHLLRVQLAEATPLGAKRGWTSAYPVVQWRATW